MNYKIYPIKSLEGEVVIPGDKSISHRSLIFGAISKGNTYIHDILKSADVLSTKSVLEKLGAMFTEKNNVIEVSPISKWNENPGRLDCGNSGTTIRLLMGLVASQKVNAIMFGDPSLSKRPMKRVSDPLLKMGAKIKLSELGVPPIEISGGLLHGINYELPVASAQVKSALILAGLNAEGETTLTGKIYSRDHTEIMLKDFGVNLNVNSEKIIIKKSNLIGTKFIVPGDPSTASFWLGAGSLIPNSKILIKNISLNPTRTGFLKTLLDMGAKIKQELVSTRGEPLGHLYVESSELNGVIVPEDRIPSMIDEVPLLALVASQAKGLTRVTGAEELRVKESDRIESVAQNIRAMGVEITTLKDGFEIVGPQKLNGALIKTHLDHRIAMVFSIAGLIARGETIIEDAEVVEVSYPQFYQDLVKLSTKLSE